MKVWVWKGIELATPGSAVRLTSVARHVTDCATQHGHNSLILILLFWSINALSEFKEEHKDAGV